MIRTVPRRMSATALVAAVLAMVSACSGENPGTPLPTQSTGSPTQSAAPSGDLFAGIQACAVLDKALQGMGYPAGEVDRAGSDNGCRTQKSQDATVGLDLSPDRSLDELRYDPKNAYPGEVNRRRSLQIRDSLGTKGGCEIGIEVAKKARAVLTVQAVNDNTDRACQLAESLAYKVEPQLPKVQ